MAPATIAELTLADDPARWEALGFDVSDGECRLGGVSLRLAGAQPHEGVLGWSLRDLSATELDGLPTGSTSPRVVPIETAPTHPNGVVAIDHIVVVSPALQRTVSALQAAGLDLRRIREEPTPAGAPRQAFFRLGREILEVVQEPEDVVASAGGEERPARFWGLALLVRDIEQSVAAFAPHAGEPRAAVQPGRRIATVRRSAGLSVPIALMSAAEGS